MQLNNFNQIQDKQILKKFKLFIILNKLKILFNIMIFIIELIIIKKIQINKNVQQLKWNQDQIHQKIKLINIIFKIYNLIIIIFVFNINN